MNRTPVTAILLAALGGAAAVLAGVAPAHAAGREGAALNAFAQGQTRAQPRPPRARTRITVRPPIYPYRTYSTTYPVPYPIEYPGPNTVRQCEARLVQEHRPSGTVIVPVTSCWWEKK
jgi:hypothetical protein